MTPHPYSYSAALAEAFDLAKLDAGARRAIAEADIGPLWRVAGGWRRNASAPRFKNETVAVLMTHGLLKAGGPQSMRILTDLGRGVAARLSRGRKRHA